MDVGNFLSKTMSNADKLGTLAGFLVGTPNGVGDLLSSIQNVMQGQIHVPDVQAGMSALMGEGNVQKGVLGAIAGYVIDELGLPYIGKFGKAIQKFSIGYAVGAVGIKMLWMSTHADEGCAPSWWKQATGGGKTASQVMRY